MIMMYGEYKDEGSLRIPLGKCTHDAFFRHLPHLRVRDLLCWALRTETTVRLAKVEGRTPPPLSDNDGDGDGDIDDEDYSYSKILKSDYLVDIYPEEHANANDGGLKSDLSRMGREEYKFSRKAHPQLAFLETRANDFDGLTPIIIEKPSKRRMSGSDEGDEEDGDSDDDELKSSDFANKQVVPPSLLHFEIIFEAYMGYSLTSSDTTSDEEGESHGSYYHSPDPSLPRAAVMGGGVVAALTAYQDEAVVRAFEQSGLFTGDGKKLQGGGRYWNAKMTLVKVLHSLFIDGKDTRRVSSLGSKVFSRAGLPTPKPCSKFSDGDVDVFLQASPLTQGIIRALHARGIGEQCGLIGSYVGNAGLCDYDLFQYTTQVMKDVLEPSRPEQGFAYDPDWATYAVSVSKHAVSCVLGKDEKDEAFGDQLWPRPSQFILLDAKADLLGGLLDFDLSVVACSYDGISVRAAPRAVLSLITNANFITPFCFEEHRNKRRVTKYSRRGFKPYLVDPNDTRICQKIACEAKILRRPFKPRSTPLFAERSSMLQGENMIEYEANKNEILRIQDEKQCDQDPTFCCHLLADQDSHQLLGHDLRKTYRYLGIMYTQKLFEVSPGDAIEFFSKRFKWTESDLRKVDEVDPYLRMACRRCKDEYMLIRVVMAQYPTLMKEYELEEDHLRGDFSYMHSSGEPNGHFRPSFYAGGVFDSTRARDNARRTVENVAMLRAQSIFEVSAYVLKHGSPEGYKKRFVYGCDLSDTLQKAWRTSLQKPARPLIGLNPERFVERCKQCKSWLVGNRYGSNDCQRCSRRD